MIKRLLLVCGPNGVGKSAVCRRLNERLPHSARVDSDWCRCVNPFDFGDELVALNRRNLSALLGNYLACDLIAYVIFSYGFHGRRREIFSEVLDDLAELQYELFPVLLTCEVEENVRRMQADGRDEQRIQRAVQQSRAAYDDVPYPRIDTTRLGIDEVVDRLLALLREAERCGG